MADLESAARRLANLAGVPLRDHSTQDFGRVPFAGARSVVVPASRSRGILAQFRQGLPRGLVAFVGTTNWLGDEQHPSGEEIVVAPGESQFDILRVAASDAVNFGLETEDLVKKLEEYDGMYGIDIFHAETDTIEFRLGELPADLSGFAQSIYEFCPDIVDQGVGTVDELQAAIAENKTVFLWWD